jgi:hypothetical protein
VNCPAFPHQVKLLGVTGWCIVENQREERHGGGDPVLGSTDGEGGGLVEPANGDAHGESLTICCYLTIYNNGGRSN